MAMKILKVLGSVCAISFVSSMNMSQAFAAPLYFYGSTYYVDYTVNEGILAEYSTVYVQEGALISQLILIGGTAAISGGTVSDMFSEGRAFVDITGGAFGNVDTISGSYFIQGGSFSGVLSVGYDRSASMDIIGGDFSGGFLYGPGSENSYKVSAFNFFGDLSLSTPMLKGSGPFADALEYETIISGTLLDGSFISQTITCQDHANVNPCSGITISAVPVPAAVWLFGSGLIGLVGVARRKARS